VETGAETQRRGRVWKFGDDINTDLMYPSSVYGLPEAEQHRHCFAANRPGWVDLVGEGDVIVGGRNYGVGSSRPAARSLYALGIRCLLAETINGLFLRNAVNFGLPALAVPGVSAAFEEGDVAEVDLATGVVANPRTGQTLQGTPLPPMLREIIAAGGLVPLLRTRGYLE
jgi:3-isopropylmalate/(R)-2-methylmalate dehydratase small subunit